MTERIDYWKKQLDDIEMAKISGYFADKESLSEKIEACISELPNWYFGYYCRAQFITLAPILEHSFIDESDYQAVLDNYSKAIELSSDNIDAYFERAYIRYLMNDMSEYKKILSDCSKVISPHPHSYFSYYMCGCIRLEYSEDYKGAIDDFTKALNLKSCSSDILSRRAMANSKLNDYENAVIDYTKAIEYHPTNGNYYYERGKIKAQLNELESAIKDFTSAINYSSCLPKAYQERGQLKEKLYDFIGAAEDFEKAKCADDLPF